MVSASTIDCSTIRSALSPELKVTTVECHRVMGISYCPFPSIDDTIMPPHCACVCGVFMQKHMAIRKHAEAAAGCWVAIPRYLVALRKDL